MDNGVNACRNQDSGTEPARGAIKLVPKWVAKWVAESGSEDRHTGLEETEGDANLHRWRFVTPEMPMEMTVAKFDSPSEAATIRSNREGRLTSS